MPRRKEYIPSPKWMLDLKTINGSTSDEGLWWQAFAKVPIEKIVLPKFYPNKLDPGTVFRILANFHTEAWWPITVDDNFTLRDGQHRLMAAKQLGLKFLDVIFVPEASLQPTTN